MKGDGAQQLGEVPAQILAAMRAEYAELNRRARVGQAVAAVKAAA